MRRTGRIGATLALGAAALWTAVATAATPPATPTGSWAGSVSWFAVYGPGESYERASMTVTFKGRTATVLTSGRSGASHDAPSATASCRGTFRLVASAGGWLVYHQASNGPTTGAGGVLNGPCTVRRGIELGVLRVRTAGRRLKAEIGTSYRDEPPRWEYRSYLTRT